MRQADIESMGIKIGGRNIVKLWYADDTCLIADNITSMRRIIYHVDDKGTEEGLGLNHIHVIHKDQSDAKTAYLKNWQTSISINGSVLEKLEHFKLTYKKKKGMKQSVDNVIMAISTWSGWVPQKMASS